MDRLNTKDRKAKVLLLLLFLMPVLVVGAPEYLELEWDVLLPEKERAILANPPPVHGNNNLDDSLLEQEGDVDALFDESEDMLQEEDMYYEDNFMESAIDSTDPYQMALHSRNVIRKYNSKKVQISGYIVPLGINKERKITVFFLAPFLGACIHVPPPPPNQMIYGEHETGLPLSAIYDPVTIQGVLKTEIVENQMATSAYSMDIHKVFEYKEE